MFLAIRIDKKAVWVLMGLYTAFLLYMMLFGFDRTVYGKEELALRLNLVPFTTIHRYVFHADAFTLGTWAVNLFGNIGVFVPYGLLLPMLWNRCRSFHGMLGTFLSGLFVAELLQLLLRVGSFDVDDFLLNAIGACIGYAVYRTLRGRNQNKKTG
ncbi:VanZ family protein [Paenibacillus sp.]|uniref:VanZ family protein n=1 Tax=Paenibacillus sp. TaxID=58172 RepID=UPI002D306DA5|nr:VanZ family protein [Paenibacillus sp.]HZG85082.1 VanZ family protein [Paenibacillus sp.]